MTPEEKARHPAITKFRDAWRAEKHGLFLWLCMSQRLRDAMTAIADIEDQGPRPEPK
jgi:hypothetical protein